MGPKCSLTSVLHFLQVSCLACYTTVLCGFCKRTNFKLLTMNRQTLKAYSRMRLKGNFTFDFTAVLKVDPTTIRTVLLNILLELQTCVQSRIRKVVSARAFLTDEWDDSKCSKSDGQGLAELSLLPESLSFTCGLQQFKLMCPDHRTLLWGRLCQFIPEAKIKTKIPPTLLVSAPSLLWLVPEALSCCGGEVHHSY